MDADVAAQLGALGLSRSTVCDTFVPAVSSTTVDRTRMLRQIPRFLFLAVLTACGATRDTASSTATSTGSRDTLARAVASVARADSAGTTLRLVSERWLVARRYVRGDDSARHIVIRETTTQRCCLNAERDMTSAMTIEARGAGDTAAAPMWRAQLDGDRGALWDDFYRVEYAGCCDQTDALVFFNLKRGGPVFVASRGEGLPRDGLAGVSVPNSPLRRLVAFHDVFTPRPVPEAAGDSAVVGVLQYGPPEGPASRIVVRTTTGAGSAYRLDRVTFAVRDSESTSVDRDLWAANGKSDAASLTGFDIVLRLAGMEGPGRTLRVPVVADTVRGEKVRGGDGFVLVRK